MTPEEELKINALLASLWERGLPLLRERLDTLDRAATAAATGDLPESLRIETLEIAHKFAGSLGMFGYAEGTAISQQLEQVLQNPASTGPNRVAELVSQLRQSLQTK